jgi:hypothetical protein
MKGKFIKKTVPETTNNLTTAIINYIKSRGGSASRINVQGQWDETRGIWRKSGSRNGVFDIVACYQGQFIAIDIKKGSDALRPDQIEFKNEVENAGGLTYEAESYAGFLEWFNFMLNL